MWESPIKTICDEMQMQLEGEVLRAVQKVGIDVDKDELIKALNYDRGQYEKGFREGYAKEKSEIIRCKDCKYYCNVLYRGTQFECGKCCRTFVEDVKHDDFCSKVERRTDG